MLQTALTSSLQNMKILKRNKKLGRATKVLPIIFICQAPPSQVPKEEQVPPARIHRHMVF